MRIFVSTVLGIAGGVFGCGLGLGVGLVLAPVLGVSSREGESAYFAAFVAMLFALAGFAVTLVLSLRWQGVRNFVGVLRAAAGAVGGLVAVVAAGVAIYYYGTEHPLSSNSAPPRLIFEIAAPAGTPIASQGVSVELQTENYRPAGVFDPQPRKAPDGATVLSGEVDIPSRASQRLLVMTLPNEAVELFRVHLPADPRGGSHRGWSAWQEGDLVPPGSSHPGFRIRYRVME